MSVTQNPENGRAYALINYKGGTAADLSGGDNTSIIGYDYHGGENQQVRLPPSCTVQSEC